MPDTLGGRLRLLRRQQHLSQEAVARAADLSLGHYKRLEHNLHSPTLETLARLADALGVDLDTLGRTPDKTGQDSHSYPDDHNPFPAAS